LIWGEKMVNERDYYCQHYTPGEIVFRMLRKSNLCQRTFNNGLNKRLKILEPCCGDGAFILPLAQNNCDIVGIDKNKDVVVASKNRFIYDSNVEILQMDSLIESIPGAPYDVAIGNFPFLGGGKISSYYGQDYREKIKSINPYYHGLADLSAHFLYRISLVANEMIFICTNTISQGRSRKAALQPLLKQGWVIYDCDKDLPWPGDANVIVSIVYMRKCSKTLYNSRLNLKPERPDPQKLAANRNKSFQGSIVLGMGFTLTTKERDELIDRDKRNGERIFPYIGGKEVNTSPTQDFHRYVINFGQMSLEEASKWPDLIDIVREKVKPERDKNKREVRKKYWWRFGEVAPALYQAIQGLPRCLVTARVTKHLCFSFQNTDRVFSHKLIVFPLATYAQAAVLQSRVHDEWTWLLSSTLGETLNYSPSDCFENFPFPNSSHLESKSSLEGIGKQLYEARAKFMVDTDQGLTKTYNALIDPDCRDPRIVQLRELHEEMDRAVLAAYGWDDVAVPAYGAPTSDTESRALAVFRDEVIDRLFLLNAELSRDGVKK
jgi:hypothetical protein